MISSTSSTDRSVRPELLAGTGQAAERADALRPDLISTESAAFLRAELQRQPEVRPEVVARARELAKDPNYPSIEALREVATQLLASPDLTEDES
jgi:hypothetical protein